MLAAKLFGRSSRGLFTGRCCKEVKSPPDLSRPSATPPAARASPGCSWNSVFTSEKRRGRCSRENWQGRSSEGRPALDGEPPAHPAPSPLRGWSLEKPGALAPPSGWQPRWETAQLGDRCAEPSVTPATMAGHVLPETSERGSTRSPQRGPGARSWASSPFPMLSCWMAEQGPHGRLPPGAPCIPVARWKQKRNRRCSPRARPDSLCVRLAGALLELSAAVEPAVGGVTAWGSGTPFRLPRPSCPAGSPLRSGSEGK